MKNKIKMMTALLSLLLLCLLEALPVSEAGKIQAETLAAEQALLPISEAGKIQAETLAAEQALLPISKVEKIQASDLTAETSEQTGCTEEERRLTEQLHAGAAVLMDMDSGRVLYEKNGSRKLPMASTTKIMTCIMALENADSEEILTASAYAAAQPKVHLGMQRGQSYRLGDLLYSMMLESHNDSAVAIAEYIGGKGLELPEAGERTKEQSREAVKLFCDRMTEKAREIGCTDTVFLTPNGLDAEAEGRDGTQLIHSATAEDMARIMRYCTTQSVQKEAFLEITETASYSFTDTEGKRTYSCSNHNAFLQMMDGVLSGKTGFTSQAGYCYVGALEQDGKQFSLALLACGWPGHKTWKWADCKKLFTYGLEQYTYREFSPEVSLPPMPVQKGASGDGDPYKEASVRLEKEEKALPIRLLTREGEKVTAELQLQRTLRAPVAGGSCLGRIIYYLEDDGGEKQYLTEERIYAVETVPEKNFSYLFRYIWKRFWGI